MSQEAEFVKKVSAKLFAESIMHTLCGFLLANPKTRRVSLFKFNMTRKELKTLFSTVDEINEAGKAYFSINKIHAYLNDNRFEFVRRYLSEEMLYLIAPYEPTLPFSEEAAADRISAAEKNAPHSSTDDERKQNIRIDLEKVRAFRRLSARNVQASRRVCRHSVFYAHMRPVDSNHSPRAHILPLHKR